MFPRDSHFTRSGALGAPRMTQAQVDAAAREIRERKAFELAAHDDLTTRRLRERIGDVCDRIDRHDLTDRQETNDFLADVVAELNEIQASL